MDKTYEIELLDTDGTVLETIHIHDSGMVTKGRLTGRRLAKRIIDLIKSKELRVRAIEISETREVFEG